MAKDAFDELGPSIELRGDKGYRIGKIIDDLLAGAIDDTEDVAKALANTGIELSPTMDSMAENVDGWILEFKDEKQLQEAFDVLLDNQSKLPAVNSTNKGGKTGFAAAFKDATTPALRKAGIELSDGAMTHNQAKKFVNDLIKEGFEASQKNYGFDPNTITALGKTPGVDSVESLLPDATKDQLARIVQTRKAPSAQLRADILTTIDEALDKKTKPTRPKGQSAPMVPDTEKLAAEKASTDELLARQATEADNAATRKAVGEFDSKTASLLDGAGEQKALPRRATVRPEDRKLRATQASLADDKIVDAAEYDSPTHKRFDARLDEKGRLPGDPAFKGRQSVGPRFTDIIDDLITRSPEGGRYVVDMEGLQELLDAGDEKSNQRLINEIGKRVDFPYDTPKLDKNPELFSQMVDGEGNVSNRLIGQAGDEIPEHFRTYKLPSTEPDPTIETPASIQESIDAGVKKQAPVMDAVKRFAPDAYSDWEKIQNLSPAERKYAVASFDAKHGEQVNRLIGKLSGKYFPGSASSAGQLEMLPLSGQMLRGNTSYTAMSRLMEEAANLNPEVASLADQYARVDGSGNAAPVTPEQREASQNAAQKRYDKLDAFDERNAGKAVAQNPKTARAATPITNRHFGPDGLAREALEKLERGESLNRVDHYMIEQQYADWIEDAGSTEEVRALEAEFIDVEDKIKADRFFNGTPGEEAVAVERGVQTGSGRYTHKKGDPAYVSKGGKELEKMAANGDVGAQDEIDRRAGNKAAKKGAGEAAAAAETTPPAKGVSGVEEPLDTPENPLDNSRHGSDGRRLRAKFNPEAAADAAEADYLNRGFVDEDMGAIARADEMGVELPDPRGAASATGEAPAATLLDEVAGAGQLGTEEMAEIDELVKAGMISPEAGDELKTKIKAVIDDPNIDTNVTPRGVPAGVKQDPGLEFGQRAAAAAGPDGPPPGGGGGGGGGGGISGEAPPTLLEEGPGLGRHGDQFLDSRGMGAVPRGLYQNGQFQPADLGAKFVPPSQPVADPTAGRGGTVDASMFDDWAGPGFQQDIPTNAGVVDDFTDWALPKGVSGDDYLKAGARLGFDNEALRAAATGGAALGAPQFMNSMKANAKGRIPAYAKAVDDLAAVGKLGAKPGFAKFGLKAGPGFVAGLGLEAAINKFDDTATDTDSTAGLKGAGRGALLGSGIGSMIAPGIGTLIGGGLGAIGGGLWGVLGNDQGPEGGMVSEGDFVNDFRRQAERDGTDPRIVDNIMSQYRAQRQAPEHLFGGKSYDQLSADQMRAYNTAARALHRDVNSMYSQWAGTPTPTPFSPDIEKLARFATMANMGNSELVQAAPEYERAGLAQSLAFAPTMALSEYMMSPNYAQYQQQQQEMLMGRPGYGMPMMGGSMPGMGMSPQMGASMAPQMMQGAMDPQAFTAAALAMP